MIWGLERVRTAAPEIIPRYFIACKIIGGKIILDLGVTGGFGRQSAGVEYMPAERYLI